MKYDKHITMEEHEELADSYAIICHHIWKMYSTLSKHFGKTHPIRKAFDKVMPLYRGSYLLKIWSMLDDEFCRHCTKDQWDASEGGIYTDVRKRYEKLKNKI